MSEPTCAAVLARTLREAGITRMFGLPGGEILEFIHAAKREGIEFLLTRHEAAASFMADVTGQIQRRPGVCVSTLGPGADQHDARRGQRVSRSVAGGGDHRHHVGGGVALRDASEPGPQRDLSPVHQDGDHARRPEHRREGAPCARRHRRAADGAGPHRDSERRGAAAGAAAERQGHHADRRRRPVAPQRRGAGARRRRPGVGAAGRSPRSGSISIRG